MANEFAINPKNGREAFYDSNNPLPWERVGAASVDGALTVKDALTAAGLDFRVEKTPVLFNYGSEEQPHYKTVAGQYTTYRDDTKEPLGVVGSRYVVAQNDLALSFFDNIVADHGAIIETAGVLNGGRTTFITAQMPPHIFVPGDDIKPYVMLINSHDGSGSITALISPVRLACGNILHMAMGKYSNRVRIAHTKSAEARVREAGRVMGLYDQFAKEMGAALTSLTEKQMNSRQVDKYIKALFASESEEKGRATSTRAENIRNEVKEYLYGESGGQQMFPGTAYQAYQGITGFFQNVKEYRTDDGAMTQGILGDDARTMVRAFTLALAVR